MLDELDCSSHEKLLPFDVCDTNENEQILGES